MEESESDDAILMSQVSDFHRSFAFVFVHRGVKGASIARPGYIINASVNLMLAGRTTARNKGCEGRLG